MKQLILLFILLFIIFTAQARKFYFSSSTGNDSYTSIQAQNPSTPWATLSKISYYVIARSGNLGTLFQPGDTLAFKRGDVFANGLNSTSWFRSVLWWNDGTTGYYRAPSGTANAPIVFTNYGDVNLPLPNMLYPTPAAQTDATNRGVFGFQDVHDIVIDGLQFNDYRFSATDKVGTALTSYGIDITNTTLSKTYNITIKNCYFNNIAYGISASGNRLIIDNNKITNLKNSGDTTGQYDVGAIPIIITGRYNRITNNYIKGGWAFTGATASGQGLNGSGIEVIAPFDSSFVGYNTIIDCDGGVEFGNLTGNTSLGAIEDTFAYNKFINIGTWMYVPTRVGAFGYGIYRKIRVWNNVYVFNQFSRMGGGPRFGTDIYGDGQSFTQFPSWGNGTGILPNSYPYSKSRNLGEYNGGYALKYGTDTGVPTDTLYDVRNNIFWVTAGVQVLPPSTYVNTKRRNNIYHILGTDFYPTKLGPNGVTLGAGERIINTAIFKDTINNNPENWDMRLLDTSYAVANGVSTGLLKDFAGNIITGNTSIGLYQQTPTTIPCTFTYGSWSVCNTSSQQTRSYTSSPSGCLGSPPTDSIRRTCTSPIIISSFYYSSTNRRIYIKCNVAGTMVITNELGSISQVTNYNANGFFINVNSLQSGIVYIAATYGRSITFRR